MEVAPLPFEKVMGLYVEENIKIARRAPVKTSLALSS
jgi:hypothetical protein